MKLEKRAFVKPVTVANSSERIKKMADKPKLHFVNTGGQHITSNDTLKSFGLRKRRIKADGIEKTKKKRVRYAEIEDDAKKILSVPFSERPMNKKGQIKPYTKGELVTLVQYYGKDYKDIAQKKVGEVRKMFEEMTKKGLVPREYKEWTKADEDKIDWLRNPSNIEMGDTYLGRAEANAKAELSATMMNMTSEEF